MAGRLKKMSKATKRRAANMQAVGSAVHEFIKGPKKKKKVKMPGGKRAPK